MPRSNSSRRQNKWQRTPKDLARSTAGVRQLTATRSGEYSVQRVRGNDSGKTYTCPGCHREVRGSEDHIVAWPTDAPYGIDIGPEARRHWHRTCFARV